MSEAHNEKVRDYMRELHDKRRAMGICIYCSGMIEDAHYSVCEKCRAKKREENAAYRENLKKLREKCEVEVIEPDESSIPEDHKCWNCVWGRYVGTGFFCPIIGTCVKDEEKQEV